MDLNEKLEQFKSMVKPKVNSSMFKTYFQDIKFIKYSNNDLTVLVGNSLAKTQLETKLNRLVDDILINIFDSNCRIKYILDNELDIKDEEEKKFKKPEQTSFFDLFEPTEEPEEEVTYIRKSNLNKDFTLENYMSGNSNLLAIETAKEVLNNPGTMINPFFIYGNSGLGKTHLMQAIGNEIEKTTNLKVLYARSGEFIDDYTEMTRSKNPNLKKAFKDKYRSIDVLMIDDIQFISGKKQTQEEFFDVFQELKNKNKQIIIASDRKPDDIKDLDDRLKSRFVWGGTAEICPPDQDLRKKILKNFILKEKVPLKMDDETYNYVAENIKDDVRKIEGAVRKLTIYLQAFKINSGNKILNNEDEQLILTLDEVKEALKDLIKTTGTTSNTSIIKIQQVIAYYYKISVDDLKAKKRTNKLAKPRQVAMYLCKNILDAPYEQIGEEFGGRDHTTVMHACRTIEESVNENSAVADTIEELKKLIVS